MKKLLKLIVGLPFLFSLGLAGCSSETPTDTTTPAPTTTTPTTTEDPVDPEPEPEVTKTLELAPSIFAQSGLATAYDTTLVSKYGATDYKQQAIGEENPMMLNYFFAKLDADNNLVLAPSGRVFNFDALAEGNGALKGIVSIKVDFTGGELYVQAGEAGGGTVYGPKAKLTSGTAFEFESKPNFFMLSNSKAETTITKVEFVYTGTDAGVLLGRLGQKYSVRASDGTLYHLERSGSAVRFLNKDGTISLDAERNYEISLDEGAVTYKGKVSEDYKTMTVTDKTGEAPALADFARTYVLEDFESYSQTGRGNNGEQGRLLASDLRAQYYGDYGGGGSTTWITNSNFNIAQSADYLNLTTDIKHSGEKSATFKAWGDGWTRAWSRETFDQLQHYNFGSGNTLSFWVHGAYKADGTASDKTVQFKVQVYYKNFVIDDGNRNSTANGTGAKDFSVAAGSDWVEKTIPLDPTKSVYAINIMMSNSGLSGTNAYVPFDDITIQNRKAYIEDQPVVAESATELTRTFNGTVNVAGNAVTVKVAIGANGYAYGWAGADMQPTKYEIEGTQITLKTAGSITLPDTNTYTYGDWVGTLNSTKDQITINKADISGTIKNVITSETITLNQDRMIATGSEGNEVLQGRFKKQYNDGTWKDVTDQTTGLVMTDEAHIEGAAAIKLTAVNNNMRMIINPTIAEAGEANYQSVAFWYYVPADVAYELKVFTYNSYTPASDYKNPYSKSYNGAVAGWRYVNIGLTSGYGKNISIFVTKTTATTYIDYFTGF